MDERNHPRSSWTIRSIAAGETVLWNGLEKITGGRKTHIEVRPSKEGKELYIGNATGRSTGLARALWPTIFSAVSQIDKKSLRPELFSLDEKERNKKGNYKIQFLDDRLVFNTVQQDTKKPGTKPSREQISSVMISLRTSYQRYSICGVQPLIPAIKSP